VNAADLKAGSGAGWADGVDAPVSLRTVRQMMCAGGYEEVEAHHVTAWQDNQETRIDNGVMLCWYHHHTIHTSGWQLRMTNGRPQVKAPPWVDPTNTWRPAGTHRATTPSNVPNRIRA
jgi:hypothetical protein